MKRVSDVSLQKSDDNEAGSMWFTCRRARWEEAGETHNEDENV